MQSPDRPCHDGASTRLHYESGLPKLSCVHSYTSVGFRLGFRVLLCKGLGFLGFGVLGLPSICGFKIMKKDHHDGVRMGPGLKDVYRR